MDHYLDKELLELANKIEKSTGLLMMVPGQGAYQLGIKATAMVIATLRECAKNGKK